VGWIASLDSRKTKTDVRYVNVRKGPPHDGVLAAVICIVSLDLGQTAGGAAHVSVRNLDDRVLRFVLKIVVDLALDPTESVAYVNVRKCQRKFQ